MSGRTLAAGLALSALAGLAQAQAQAPAQGTMPASAAPCLSCHSVDGRPLLADVPIIAGQQVAYLVHALTSYRDGNRKGGQALVMQQFAKDLDDREIAGLAKWFGEAR